jgi:hypothetical protein
VLLALRWLAAHQALDGRFATADFGRWCEGRDDVKDGPGGAGNAQHDVGATALALCAFLGAGYSNRGDHEFAEVVRRGLVWLRGTQDADGFLRTGKHDTWAFDHACATLALVEAYGLTESTLWHAPAQRALTALERLRQPADVWRYGVTSDVGDFALSLWATLPLVSARLCNADAERREKPLPFVLDADAFPAVLRWIANTTRAETGTLETGVAAVAGRALPGGSPRALNALAVLVRVWGRRSQEPDPALDRAGAALIAAAPEKDEPADHVDMVQRWAGTCAAFMVGKDGCRTWERGLDAAVVRSQHVDGDYCALRGSWDPVGTWASEGGRVVMTALLCMALEVNFRYATTLLAR